jgi:Retrotransposon gag protein
LDTLGSTRRTCIRDNTSLQLNIPATEEWVYFPPRTSNELPPHVLGTAEWYPIGTEGHSTYHVKEDFPSGRFEYQFCEFINDTWFITQWNEEHSAFRTHQGLRLSLDIQRQAGLGYWNITNPQHHTYVPLQIGTPTSRSYGLRTQLATPSIGSKPEAHTPEEQEPQSGRTDTFTEATLVAATGQIVTLQGIHPLTPEPPQPTMTTRIASQIHDFITRHRSPPAPQITSMAAPAMSSGHGHASGSGETATIAMTTATSNGKLAGLPPTVFTGERTESNKFLKEFKQWRLLNHDHIEMKQAYNCVLMALTYIKGPKVDNWQEARLEELVNSNLVPDDETLWTNFEQRFKDAYTDSNKKRAAYDKLMTLQMKGGDIDTYIATFDNLLAKAGWTRGEEATDFFQKGLEDRVKCEILHRQTWPITLQEWQEATRDETNRYKA